MLHGDDEKRGNIYFFFHGILLKHEQAYAAVEERRINELSSDFAHIFYQEKNFAQIMSKYAAFPVSNLANEAMKIPENDRFRWYLDGTIHNKTFTPKFSNRHYHLKDGVLESITTNRHGDKIMLGNYFEGTEGNEEKKENPVKPENSANSNMIRIAQAQLDLSKMRGEIKDTPGKIWVCTETGEIIEIDDPLPDGSPQLNLHSSEETPILPKTLDEMPFVVQALVKSSCYKVFSSYEEFECEVPSTVIDALDIWIDDAILNSNFMADDTYTKTRFKEAMLETLFNDKITLQDLVGNDCKTIEEYVLAAYLDEVASNEEDDDDDKHKNVVEAEFEEIAPEGSETLPCSCVVPHQGPAVILPMKHNFPKVASDAELEAISETDRQNEDGLARGRLTDIITKIDGLRKEADELTSLLNSDLAQESAHGLYTTIDYMTQRLGDICGQMRETGLVRHINSITSNA
jgi:hypothetical protein